MSTNSAPPGAAAADHHRAAPALQRIAAHTRLEARTLLGNGEQLLVALVLPALVLLALVFIPLPASMTGGRTLTLSDAVAATAATALIATSMTSQSIATAFDRRGGVLRWIATTPLGRSGYLIGKLAALAVIHLLQVLALGGAALLLGWRPSWTQLAGALPIWVLGAGVFGLLGLLIAGTLRAEGVLAVSNLAFIAFVAGGGIGIPVDAFPTWLQPLIHLLPSGALMDLLRPALSGGALSAWPVLVLLLWGAAAAMLTVKFFKWTSV